MTGGDRKPGKPCKVCGRPYLPTLSPSRLSYKYRQTCGRPACVLSARRGWTVLQTPTKRVCVECLQTFEPSWVTARYCSADCHHAYARRRAARSVKTG